MGQLEKIRTPAVQTHIVQKSTVFANHITFDGPVSRIYKEPLNLINKQPINKGQRSEQTLDQGRYTDGKHDRC